MARPWCPSSAAPEPGTPPPGTPSARGRKALFSCPRTRWAGVSGAIFRFGRLFLRGQRGQIQESRIHAGLPGFGCGGKAGAVRGQSGGKQIRIREREINHSFIYRPLPPACFPFPGPAGTLAHCFGAGRGRGFPWRRCPRRRVQGPRRGVLAHQVQGLKASAWRALRAGGLALAGRACLSWCRRGRAAACWFGRTTRPAGRAPAVFGEAGCPAGAAGRYGAPVGLLLGSKCASLAGAGLSDSSAPAAGRGAKYFACRLARSSMAPR